MERGWEVFSLQYHVDGPLGAVLSPDAMAGEPTGWGSHHSIAWQDNVSSSRCRVRRLLRRLPAPLAPCWLLGGLGTRPTFAPAATLAPCPRPAGYLRIFRLLWTIKHVEAVLGKCWDAINAAQRALAAMRAQERLHGVAVDNVELVGGSLEGGWGSQMHKGRAPKMVQHRTLLWAPTCSACRLCAGATGAAGLPRAARRDGQLRDQPAGAQGGCSALFVVLRAMRWKLCSCLLVMSSWRARPRSHASMFKLLHHVCPPCCSTTSCLRCWSPTGPS